MSQSEKASREEVNRVQQHVDSLEGKVEQLGIDMAGVKTSLAGMANQLSTLGQNVQVIANNLNSSSKTDWHVLATWASVILILIGMYAHLLLSPVEVKFAHLEEVHKLQAELAESQREAILKVSELRDKALEEKIDSLKTPR